MITFEIYLPTHSLVQKSMKSHDFPFGVSELIFSERERHTSNSSGRCPGRKAKSMIFKYTSLPAIISTNKSRTGLFSFQPSSYSPEPRFHEKLMIQSRDVISSRGTFTSLNSLSEAVFLEEHSRKKIEYPSIPTPVHLNTPFKSNETKFPTPECRFHEKSIKSLNVTQSWRNLYIPQPSIPKPPSQRNIQGKRSNIVLFLHQFSSILPKNLQETYIRLTVGHKLVQIPTRRSFRSFTSWPR